MTDRYADLRDLLDLTQTNVFNRDDVRALLADYDRMRKFIENEARKAEGNGSVSLAKRCRAALAQEQGGGDGGDPA